MAATTNIICYPLTTYFNAMGGASWMSSAYQNAATYTDSDKAWGAFGYNNNGNRRTVVFKFTTPFQKIHLLQNVLLSTDIIS